MDDLQGEFRFLRGLGKPRAKRAPVEFKIIALRECPVPSELQLCDTPEKAAMYWRMQIARGDPRFDPEVECLAALFLNMRRRIRGHKLLSTGTHNILLVDPVMAFRYAVALPAPAVVFLHNLCAAAHKLCYVKRRFMCGHRPAPRTLTGVSRRMEGYA